MLLRRISPLAAVLVLLAPLPAHASSNSPDPPPGAKVLAPDPAPTAKPLPKPAPAHRAQLAANVALPVPRTVGVVSETTVPAQPVVAAPSAPRRSRVETTRARTRPPAPVAARKLALPPVLGPSFLALPASSREPVLLAALALGVAVLTAGSGAGLVFTWSRR